MTKKRFDETSVLNELKGNSRFFQRQEVPATEPPSRVEDSPAPSEPPPARYDAVTPRHHDTTADTTIPWYHGTILETARRAVKQFGKEAATHRFTVEEKRKLKAIEHSYQEKGIRTSENEITRIAINYIIEEYHTAGDKSILAQVIALLNS